MAQISNEILYIDINIRNQKSCIINFFKICVEREREREREKKSGREQGNV